MRWITPFNYNPAKHSGEINTQPSMTIPDQTMTIQEILTRYAKGLPIGGSKTPYYDGVEDPLDGLPDPRTLDISERKELEAEIRQELADKKRQLLNAQKPKRSVTQDPGGPSADIPT